MLKIPRLLRAGRSLAFPNVLPWASHCTGANTVAAILTQADVHRGCPSAQTGGEVHIVSFNLRKLKSCSRALITTGTTQDELWFLPCHCCNCTDFSAPLQWKPVCFIGNRGLFYCCRRGAETTLWTYLSMLSHCSTFVQSHANESQVLRFRFMIM